MSAVSINSNWRIQQVLEDNGMEIPEQCEVPSTLMMAVAMAVLGSVDHADKLQQYCKKYVKNIIETKTISKKLESLLQGDRWISDYYTNPQLKCFERLNLELVSVIFSAKIVVYTVNQEQFCLKAAIYNNKCSLQDSDKDNLVISLYQHDHKHYHCAKFIKQTLNSPHIDEALMNKILGDENISVITNGNDNKSPAENLESASQNLEDIPAEVIVSKRIEQPSQLVAESPGNLGEWTQQSGQRRQSFQRRHKKSLSDTFNPFQVRVPNEFLDLFKGSNDFTANSQFLSLISAHHSTFAQKDNNNINTFSDFRQIPPNQGNSMVNNSNDKNINAMQQPTTNNHMISEQTQNFPRSSSNTELINSKNHNNNNIFNIDEHEEMLGMANHMINNNNNNNSVNSPSLGQNIQGTLSNETQPNEQNQSLNQHNQLHNQQIDFFNSLPSIMQSYPTAPINLLTPNFNEISKLSPPSLGKSLSFSNPSQQQQQSVLSQIQNNQQQQQQQQLSSINENLRRYMGSLKFFDENKNYGFIVMDDDNRDIFVHYDDLQKAGITKEFLKSSKQGNVIRFSFSCMQYIGKYKQSKKAVELQVMPYNPALSALRRQYHFSYISATPSS